VCLKKKGTGKEEEKKASGTEEDASVASLLIIANRNSKASPQTSIRDKKGRGMRGDSMK